jgi:UDP-glucuronate 4-epimerase
MLPVKKQWKIYGQLYNQLYDLDIIGLRFFTVYGPRGRPDMAPYKFMNAIKNEEVIYKYGKGDSFRDYTYVSDIVQGIVGAINSRKGGFEVYNLGNGNPITLNEFISTCEKVSWKTAKIKEIENQQGDVPGTYADINKAKKELGYNPKVKLEEGLNNVLNNDKNENNKNNKNK